MANKWTDEELKILKQYDGCNSFNQVVDELTELINRPAEGIKAKFFEMGFKTKCSCWTQEETDLLKKIYSTTPMKELIKALNKSEVSIHNKAHALKLYKSKDYIKRQKLNQYIEQNNCYKMYTHDMKYYCIIDKDDYEKAQKYYWYMNYDGYFVSSYKKGKTMSLHKYLLLGKSNENVIIDHINRNRYDNRKKNLRIVTAKTNINNRGIGDGVLKVQDNLFRCYYTGNTKQILYEGAYAECQKAIINEKNIDMNIFQKQLMYQIPGLFELLSEEDKKKCLEDLQKEYKNKLKI